MARKEPDAADASTTSRPGAVTIRVLPDFLVLFAALIPAILASGGRLNWLAACVIFAGVVAAIIGRISKLSWMIIGFALILLIASAYGFLPQSENHFDSERAQLANAWGINLSLTHSWQPAVSAEKIAWLAAGLIWALYLFAYQWSLDRRVLLSGYCGIITFAVIVHAVARHFGWHGKIWPLDVPFGFFANRNQMANLMAGAFLVGFALTVSGRKIHLGWLAATATLALFLPLTESRAGLLIAFLAATTWLLLSQWHSERRELLNRGFAIISGLVLILALAGSSAWHRVVTFFAAPQQEFRLLLQLDTIEQLRTLPISGVGLGNFEPVLALGRHYASVESRALHPESDWLWLAVEIGWPATLFLMMFVAGILITAWPSRNDPERSWKLVGWVWAAFFCLHGFVDVSGHRLGTLWPTILLFAMAQPSRPILRGARFIAAAAGMAAVGAGMLLLMAQEGHGKLAPLPGQLLDRVEAAARENRLNSSARDIEEGVRRYPLAWQFYFWRGTLSVVNGVDPGAAAIDFARARLLEPRATSLPLGEARLWLRARNWPATTFAWDEALRRSHDDDEIYSQFVRQARGQPELENFLQHRLLGRERRVLAYLPLASAAARADLVLRLLAVNPELRGWSVSGQQAALNYAVREAPAELRKHFSKHPHLAVAQWQVAAKLAAAAGDYESAVTLVTQHLAAGSPEGEDWRALKLQLALHPDDMDLAVRYLDTLVAADKSTEALEWLKRRKIDHVLSEPLSVRLIKILAQTGSCREAWQAWEELQPSGKTQ